MQHGRVLLVFVCLLVFGLVVCLLAFLSEVPWDFTHIRQVFVMSNLKNNTQISGRLHDSPSSVS